LIADASALAIEEDVLPLPHETLALVLLMVTETVPLSYTVGPVVPPLIEEGADTVKEGDEKYELLGQLELIEML